MIGFTSNVSPKTYLNRELDEVYFRLYGKHQGRVCKWSACSVHGDVEDYFLAPHASVIAAQRVLDNTPIIDIAVGDRFTIDGALYEVRDDKRLDNPYFARVTE
jgi:hypothetical protein